MNFPFGWFSLPQSETLRGLRCLLLGSRSGHFPLHAHAALPGRLSIISTQSRLGFFNLGHLKRRFTSPSAHVRLKA